MIRRRTFLSGLIGLGAAGGAAALATPTNWRPHVVIVTHRASADGLRPLCVHNIGAGARLDDALFAFDLTGHYRFKPVSAG